MNSTKEPTSLDLNVVKDIIFSDIYRLIESFGLEFTQEADNIFMRCPVHEGADNPTGCSISTRFRVWKCWTRGCHEHYGTDIFGFIKGVLDTDSFGPALSHVAKLYDINGAKGHVVKKKTESDLAHILKHFNNKPHEIVESTFEPVKTCGDSPYFESRGFQPETLRLFGVEDCSDKYSKMRHRAIIPIFYRGNQLGYIARATKQWLQPKYLFSGGIRKTDYFYNWDRAIFRAHEVNTLFIVEGQGDVWKMHEAGVINCVGLFGSAMSESQKRILLTSGITNLVILTDNDEAGRAATVKIRRELNRMFNLIFPQIPHSKDIGGLLVEQLQSGLLQELKGLY